MRDRQTLLVYARYDLTFPVDLSEDLVREFRARGIPHEIAVLRCGHYSSGKAPFKFVDGWILTRFLKRALRPAYFPNQRVNSARRSGACRPSPGGPDPAIACSRAAASPHRAVVEQAGRAYRWTPDSGADAPARTAAGG